METTTVKITRYPNRRLYDHQQRRYVTLPEIEEMVRGGTDVAVRDSKTGEDLTRSILTQIILERYPERMELFPIQVLQTIIRANDLALGFLRDYLRLALTYLEALQPSSTPRPFLGPLGWIKAFLLADFQSQPTPGASPPDHAGPSAEELTRRVAELERQLAEGARAADHSGPTIPPKAEPVNGRDL